MGKKKRTPGGDAESSKLDVRVVLAGIVVLAVAIVGGSIIGTRFLVSADDDASALELPAFAGDVPDIARSSVADLLASTSVEDMTPEQRSAVKAETVRVYGDAQFRVDNPVYLGVDIVRRNGETLAARQYAQTDAPGGLTLSETITFFCRNEDGTIERYRAIRSVDQTTAGVDKIEDGQQAMERIIDDLDWTQAKDLGLEEIGGRQARGVELQYDFDATQSFRTQVWFDVENARVLRYVQYDEQGNASPFSNYDFDWRIPPRIEPAANQDVPCYERVYG